MRLVILQTRTSNMNPEEHRKVQNGMICGMVRALIIIAVRIERGAGLDCTNRELARLIGPGMLNPIIINDLPTRCRGR